MPIVGTREINNVEVQIHADRHGTWSISMMPEGDGKQGRVLATHSVLDSAIVLARKEIKKLQVKVAVPFKTGEGKRGIATGRHARSREKILTDIAGKKEHVGYRDQVFKADMPQSVVDHLNEIDDELRKLQTERRDLIKKWVMDLGKAVDEAINKATEEQQS